MSKWRVVLHSSSKKSASALVPSRSLDELSKIASNKLRIKTPRFFLSDTAEEVTAENISDLKDDIALMVTKGDVYTVSKDGDKDKPKSKKVKPFIHYLHQKSEVDGEAKKQLEGTTERLSGIVVAVGMPDLHPGNSCPIGTAFASRKVFYPHLIGGDIGCGMALIETNLTEKDSAKKDRWASHMQDLDVPYEKDAQAWLFSDEELQKRKFPKIDKVDYSAFVKSGVDIEGFEKSLGTIGGGNHFAELQVVDKVVNEARFNEMKLNRNSMYLLVHSGSRGLGPAVLDLYSKKGSNAGIDSESEQAKDYLSQHDNACLWAKRNRALIATRILSSLNAECKRCILDIWHNNLVQAPFCVEDMFNRRANHKGQSTAVKSDSSDEKTDPPASDKTEMLFLHRKGAAPSDQGPIVIPGSRGAFSFLVQPIGDKELAGYSLAHGAGRKWTRHRANEKGRSKFPNADQLKKTALGSVVVCDDKDLLYEESPDAYKDISDIIDDLTEQGLVEVIAVMRPVLTYKTRSEKSGGGD